LSERGALAPTRRSRSKPAKIRETGRKSFTLDYTFEGRRRRVFIGYFAEWSTVAAREQAKRIKRDVDRGNDPLAVRDERRTAPTVKDLVECYLNEHVSRLSADSASDRRARAPALNDCLPRSE
jgi:Arm DNA-binding domain